MAIVGGRVVVWCAAVLTAAVAAGDESKPYVFRGIEPGVTTSDVLVANERWGTPQKEEHNTDGSLRWQYQPQGYKQASCRFATTACNRSMRRCQTAWTSRRRPQPRVGDSGRGGKAERGGPHRRRLPQEWKPVVYSAGRVVLFIDPQRKRVPGARGVTRVPGRRLRRRLPIAADNTALSYHPGRVERSSAASREIIAGLAKVFPQQHISGHPVDEEIRGGRLASLSTSLIRRVCISLATTWCGRTGARSWPPASPGRFTPLL